MRGNRWESSCLDHVYSNLNQSIIDAFIIESGISDHFSTLTKMKGIKYIDISKAQIYKRKQKLSENEIINLNADLSVAIRQYNRLDGRTNVDEKNEFLAETYNTLNDKYRPLKKLSRKEKYYHFKPWYTKGIKISISTENNLRRLSVRLKDEEIAKQYRKYRNLLTRIKTLANNV